MFYPGVFDLGFLFTNTQIKRMFSTEELDTVSEIHATFSYHGHVCIVMELLGMNLYEVITLRRNRGMPLELISQVARCTLTALAALHRIGYVHTDVKPENILIQSGNSAETKLCDFGSVKQIGDNYDQYIQTRYYRSPETILQIPFDEKIDVWSVGCVVAELFLGLPLLPGVNKENQIVLIDRMFGPFPESMVEECPVRDFFFRDDGTMRSFADMCADLGIAVPQEYNYHRFQRLPDIINTYGRTCDYGRKQQMINFIEQCLTLDPAQRPSATELLHHEFVNPM